VRITSPDRVYWPAVDGHGAYTKRDLLEYLVAMSQPMLRYLHDRPLTLLRYPTGLKGKYFFQKHVEFEPPPFVARESLISEHTGLDGTYLFCNNLETLVWLGQIGNLEFHTWYARRSDEPDAIGLPHTFSGSVENFERSVLNYPEFMVFDLDPYVEVERDRFKRTCQVAHWLKDALDALGLKNAYVKTSGKTGLHIFVPILRQFDFDTVRKLSEQICRYVLAQHPHETTMEWSQDKRTGKVFLDHNQNTRGKTLATPYSPRALPGAPVSMPIRWTELDTVRPMDFTLSTAPDRLAQAGDIWSDILDHKADLNTILR
jgi:bifunctional non-homologous end joining protein LigD